MVRYVPKNYRCTNCGREQYSNEFCFGCKSKSSFEQIKTESFMKKETIAKIESDSYVCNAGFWTTEYYVETEYDDDFKDIIKKFEGKRVKITIEEI